MVPVVIDPQLAHSVLNAEPVMDADMLTKVEAGHARA